MPRRNVIITIKGEDKTGKAFQNVAGKLDQIGGKISKAGGAASKATSPFASLGSALGGVATVAGGIIAAGVLSKMASGLAGFAKMGLEAVGASQQLDTSLNALFTSNLMYERSIEQVTAAQQKSGAEMEADRQRLARMQTQRSVLTARIQEQKQRVHEMTTQWTEEGLATQTAKAKLADMEMQLVSMDSEMADLTGTTKGYSTQTVKTYNQVMTMAEAQGQARDATKKLRAEIDKIAVISPFEAAQVEEVAKFAVQAGMSADASADFTAAFLDLASAVGIGSADLGFAADQLLQVQKAGKLTAIDLRQLRRLGIDLEKIIGVEMGMSIEEFNKKAGETPEVFDDLFKAVQSFSENTFAGTAEQFSKTLPGMISAGKDLFEIGARDMFLPIVEAVGPIALEAIDRLSDIFLGGNMKEIGEGIAGLFETALGVFSGDEFAIYDFIQALTDLGMSRDMVVSLTGEFAKMQDVINAFRTEGLMAGLDELSAQFPGLSKVITFVTENWDALKGALIGVGAVLAGGIIAGALALVAGLLATILSPIGLLVAAAAALGAAWMTNFMGIRDYTMQAWAVLEPMLTQLGEWLTTNIPVALKYLTDMWTQNWPLIQQAATQAWEVLKAIFAGLMQAMGPAVENLQTAFGNLTEALSSMGISWGDIFNALATAVGVVFAAIGAMIVMGIATFTGLVNAVAAGLATLTSYLEQFRSFFDMTFQGMQQYLTALGQFFIAVFAGEWPAALEALKLAAEGAANMVIGAFGMMATGVQALFHTIYSTIEGFVTGVINFFTGLYDSLVGGSIIPDLIMGIIDWFGRLAEPVLAVINTIAEQIATIIGGIFEWLTSGGGEGISIDFSGMVKALTTDIPAAANVTTAAFTELFNTATEMMISFIEGAVSPFIMLLIETYETHVPTLQSVWVTAMQTMATAMTVVLSITRQLISAIQQLIGLLKQLQSAARAVGTAFETGFKKAKSAIDDLIPKLETLHQWLEDIEEAAKRAADAIENIPSSIPGGAPPPPQFQRGTPPGGFRVPGGGGRPFPLTVHGGELVHVIPSGTARQRGGGGDNYFTINLPTAATAQEVEMSLQTLMTLYSNAG